MFCEVTVTSDYSVHPQVQVDVCAKFQEMPSRCYCDIVFTRMGHPENIMPLATTVTSMEAQKNDVLYIFILYIFKV